MFPEIEPPAITIITLYPGAGAEDVETKVTQRIEEEINTVNNIKEIYSTSKQDISLVRAEFEWGTDLDEATNDLRERIDFARRDFPKDVEQSWLFKLNTSVMPILFYGFSADKSYEQLYYLVDKKIADPLRRIPGVGLVGIWTELERQILVQLDPERLQGYNLSVQQIEQTLAQENLTLPAGSIKSDTLEYTIRVPGEFERVEEIQDVVVGHRNGSLIYLKDVAQVKDSFEERINFVRTNQKRGLMMFVRKQVGANTVEVARLVKKKVLEAMENLPPDIEYYLGFDQSRFIHFAIKNLSESVVYGAVLVILVVFLFLRQIRGSIIIILTIPFSLIVTFIMLFCFGYTLNMISLMSLAIAVGMVVDDAIVVLENIFRHREQGVSPKEAALVGTSEVGLAVIASTLTTVVIFIPLIFLTEITGILFRQLAFVVGITILASLFASLTFIPMACSHYLKPPSHKKSSRKLLEGLYNWSEQGFLTIEESYSRLLSWSLLHRKVILACASVIFLITLVLAKGIGTEFMPEEDTGDIQADIEFAVGTKLEETERIAKKLEKIFYEQIPEMESTFIRGGQTKAGIYSAVGGKEGPHVLQVRVRLVEQDKRQRSSKEIAQALRKEMMKIPGIMKLNIQSGNPFMNLLFGGSQPISIEIIGHSIEETNMLAQQIKDIVQEVKGTVDVKISRDLSRPELWVLVDRRKASLLGLNISQIADTIRTNFYGREATKFREEGEDYDIFLRLQESYRKRVTDIENITIASPLGSLIKLKNIASIKETFGPIELERKNLERIVKVEAGIYGRSLGEVVADIQEKLKRIDIPPNITIEFGGEVEEKEEAFSDLMLILILAVVLVYMVMASQFESLIDPFVVMFSIPFAFVGTFLFLRLSHTYLGVTSFIGIIMLMGIVVKNAIVLVDYINLLRARGLSLWEAIKLGGKNRLRPVLMTTFTTLLGILPLAVARGEGADLWRPMAITVIGGLLISTLVTLVLVPTIYSLAEERLKRSHFRL
jgi:HAE1 family hydrophobic/amphiphilic exporter-1